LFFFSFRFCNPCCLGIENAKQEQMKIRNAVDQDVPIEKPEDAEDEFEDCSEEAEEEQEEEIRSGKQ
jgi:hypothetical protein